MFSCLKALDFFGSTVKWRVRTRHGTKDKFQSYIGAFLTVGCVTTVLVYSYFVLTRLMEGHNDKLSEELLVNDFTEPLNFSEAFFMPYFKFEADQFYLPSEFKVDALLKNNSKPGAYTFDLEKLSNLVEFEVMMKHTRANQTLNYLIPMTNCKRRWLEDLGITREELNPDEFEQHMCIDFDKVPDREFVLHRNERRFDVIEIYMFECMGRSTCLPDSDILKFKVNFDLRLLSVEPTFKQNLKNNTF